MNTTPFFPIFIPLKDKRILLYGAGTVGQRRIASLLPFSPKIIVRSENIPQEFLHTYAEKQGIFWQKKRYTPGEIQDCDFVLAATSSPEVNHAIYLECREKKIPVNNASCQEECDFFFPAIVQKEDITIGLCSSGKNHTKVRQAAASLRDDASFPF